MSFDINYPASSFLEYPPFLSEISDEYRDKRFAELKSDSLKTAKLLALGYEYYKHPALKEWSDRIAKCSPSLFFKMKDSNYKLSNSAFCHCRICPMCAGRKSAMWRAKSFQILPKLKEDFPKTRYILLTLTIENVPIESLKIVLSKIITHAKKKFWDNINYKLEETFLGAIQKFECTQEEKRKNYCHPHYHYLIAVSENYFTPKYYLERDEYQNIWGKALQSTYKPFVDVRSVDKTEKGLIEVLKYELKPANYRSDFKWLSEFSLQVSGTKTYINSGIFKKYFSFLEPREKIDLIHEADDTENNFSQGSSKKLIRFDYSTKAKNYCIKEKK